MQANIVRLKSFRNEVYAHATSTQLDNATFESLWLKIAQALVELHIPQNDVNDLKTCPLGHEEEIYVERLKTLKSEEEKSMKVLEAIECSINCLTQITEENRDGIKQLHQSALEQQNNIHAIQSSVNHSSQIVKDNILEKNCSKESDEDLLRKLAKHNFKSKIRSKVKLFHPGSREWLLQQVDEFVNNKHNSSVLLLTAGPGFGKSVFAAKVCEDFKMKGKLAASHFCDFSNSNLRDPMIMLQSLASQMCENITGFKEKLVDQLRRPHQVQSLKDAFRIYLQNPLDELDLEEPTLVVIDGLDESAADDKNEIMNLIADYFKDLPECIKFLVTSRPEISIGKLNDVQRINIDSDDTNNDLDLELYLKACLPCLADRKANIPLFFEYGDPVPTVCEELAKTKCQGSFLYAFYVQSELRKRDDLDKMTLDEIMTFVPEGLDSIYLKYFNRLEKELNAIRHGSLDVLSILEMLAVSEGPLPLSFISHALGLASDCRETTKIINKVNETVSCLLYVSDDLVTVFHKSVIDWLLAEGYKNHEYTVNVSDGNKSLWLRCEQVFEEIKKTICSLDDLDLTNDVKYALDHGFRYLKACNMEESFFWVVDFVIIYVVFTIYPFKGEYLVHLWAEILHGSVVTSDELRERILWHVFEIDFLRNKSTLKTRSYYLKSVLTHSPEGCFSDNEKKIAESLLSKVRRFVEYSNFNEVEVLPFAAWHHNPENPEFWREPEISAVGLSHDKAMAAVGNTDRTNVTISVISVPSLVKLWEYSAGLESIRLRTPVCCVFGPDDSFVLFGILETVLNIAERKQVPFFHGNKEFFASCAFSPNGKRLLTSNGSNTIKLWDVSRQSLLSLLCADVCVDWCSFSSTGLFIIGDRKDVAYVPDDDWVPYGLIIQDRRQEDSFCVWNAITWQRSDERNIRDVKLKELGVLQKNKKCNRCFRPGFKELNSSKRLEIELCMPLTVSRGRQFEARSTGIYNGVNCIFSLKDYFLSVIESIHFTTLASWNFFVDISYYFEQNNDCLCKITALEDDLWFYADVKKLIVFRTLAPTQEQLSRLPRPTRVLSSSFSPDGSRLATCTSDGNINIWNVYTSQVEQRFKSNQGDSSFACWWSEECLFVFDFFDRTPSLTKYLDDGLEIIFFVSLQVSLCHLLEEFVSLSALVDFSEGLLIFECGSTNPVKVLDVNGTEEPRMVTLPEIKTGMNIVVSPDASFVFGGNIRFFYIWERITEEPVTYEVFYSGTCASYDGSACCFTNDSKIAVVRKANISIVDLVGDDDKRIRLEESINSKFFCLRKDRVVIAPCDHVIHFLDMDSGALLNSSFQRYLTNDSLKQLKLSPKETTIALPKINGDMEFLRLCIPQDPLLSRMKREAAAEWPLGSLLY
ncbi:E3 ubiquitin- ligase DZIP3 [Paramuricea clavata]|uniref:E3 ubiquitin- ligase DZIP3 n=1 Tax=Paramuricea clavata TaxID=317549 RepID=A0A6S7K2M8_PARCT|nr:E3 ubiquitin- ligase DZIP3 [Paramuricea clavata]